MGTMTTLLSAVQAAMAATGAAVFPEYEKTPLQQHKPTRYLTVGYQRAAFSAPVELPVQAVYPLALTLRIAVFDHAGADPAALYDCFEAHALAPLLDGDYRITGIRTEPAALNRALHKMELTGEITLLCSYTREADANA